MMLPFGRIRTSATLLRSALPRCLSTYTILHPVPTTSSEIETIANSTLPAYQNWLLKTRVHEIEPKLNGIDLTDAYYVRKSPFMLLMKQMTPSDIQVVLHLMSSMNELQKLQDLELEYIMRKIYKAGSEEEIKAFRKILSYHVGRTDRYSFSSADTAIGLFNHLAKLNSTSEILHWHDTLQNACGMKPNAIVYNEIVCLLATSDRVLWDAILYVLGEMHFHGLPVSMRACETVLKLIPEEPSSRWRFARQLLLDQLDTSQHQTQRLEIMSPVVLSGAFLAMYNARQSRVLMDLYLEIQARYRSSQTTGEGRVLPIYDPKVLLPLGLAAVELRNTALLFEVLRNSLTGGVDVMLNSALFNDLAVLRSSKAEIQRAKYAQLLVEDTLQLMARQGAGGACAAGHHTGLVILWLLDNDKAALAVYLWNRLVQSLIEEMQNNPEQASEQAMSQCIATVYGTLSQAISSRSASTDSSVFARNKKVLKFLTAACGDGGISADVQQELMDRFADLSVESVLACEDSEELADADGAGKVYGALMCVDLNLSVQAANAALQVFINMHERQAAFTLWKRCLEQAVPVDERLSNDLLDQLMEEGDFTLAMAVVEYLTNQEQEKFAQKKGKLLDALDLGKFFGRGKQDEEIPRNSKKKSVTAAALEQKGRDLFVRSQKRDFSPYLYTVGMKAMAASGNTEKLFRVLSEEIPGRGFVPSNSAYSVAIKALKDAGKYAEAVQLFQICCDQKAEFVSLHKSLPKELSVQQQLEQLKKDPKAVFHKKIAFTNYSLAAESPYSHSEMLLTTLECCAHARLGMEALRIFSERENLMVKGLHSSFEVDVTQSMLQQVLVALSTPEHCGIIPDFLLSSSTLQQPITLSPITLTLAVAAGVAAQDAGTIGRVLDFGKGFSYHLEQQVQSKEQMVSVVQQSLLMASAQEEEAHWLKTVMEFVSRCEHFVNLK